jgi:predicted Zn-dependent peptidase
MVVVGKFNKENLIALLKRYFEPIRKKRPAIRKDVPDVRQVISSGARVEKITHPTQMSILVGGFRVPSSLHKDMPVLEVISYILSAGESSRFHKKLVRDERIAVQCGSFLKQMKHGGVFIFYSVYFPHIPNEKMTDRMLAEIYLLKREEVSPDELMRAKNQLQTEYVRRLQTVEGRSIELGLYEILRGGYREFFRDMNKYERITSGDLMRVAKDYFIPERLAVVNLLPSEVH